MRAALFDMDRQFADVVLMEEALTFLAALTPAVTK